MLTINKKPLYS